MSSSPTFDPLNPPALKSRRSISPLGCIAILFGCLFLAIVAVGIVGIFALRNSFRQAEDSRKESSQWQLPPGQPIDAEIKRVIGSAGIQPQDDPVLAEVQQLVSSDTEYSPLPIDLARFSKAVEQSNAAVIDWPTRMVLKHQVSEEYLTTIWSSLQNKVLHTEWIKQNEEARIFVLSDSSYTDARSIYVLWLIRSDQSWKVYDSKDLLEPLSQADYLANAYSLMDGESLYRFQETIGEMDDARQIAAYAVSTRVEKPFTDMALLFALSMLEDLSAWDEMEQVASRVDTQKCKYGWYYLAKIAAEKKDYQQAVAHYRNLIDEFGWFPGLPQLLGDWQPTTAEDQLLVRQCLVNELYTLEYNYELKQQVDLNLPELISAIAQFIQPLLDKDLVTERLFTRGVLANQEAIQQMLDSIKDNEKFDSIRPELEGLLAYHQGQWDRSASLLSDAVNNHLKQHESADTSPIVRLYVESLLQSEDLLKHCQAISEKQKFVDFTLNYVLADSSIALPSHERLTQLIEWIESQQIESRRPFLVPLVKAMSIKEIEPDRSMKLALQIHQQVVEELSGLGSDQQLSLTPVEMDSEPTSPTSVASNLYSLIADLVSKEEAWQRYREELNAPDVAFLLRANRCKLPCGQAELSEAIQWYESKIEGDGDDVGQPWIGYYKSKLAFCNGQWDDADDQLQKTIAFVGEDNWTETLATMWLDTPPFYAYQLSSIRTSIALRCGRLDDYLSKLLQETASNSSDPNQGNTFFSSLAMLTTTEFPILLPDLSKFRPQLPQNEEALTDAFDALELNRLVAQGDHQEAWRLALQLIKRSSEESPFENIAETLDIGLAVDRLDEIDQADLDLQQRRTLKVVTAIAKNDVGLFRTAIESIAAEENNMIELELHKMPNTEAAILSNGWGGFLAPLGKVLYPEVSKSSLQLIAFDDDRSITELVDAISTALAQGDEPVTSIEATTVDHCVAAWRLTKEQHPTTVLLLNQDAGLEIKKGNACWPETSWTLAIQHPNLNRPATIPYSGVIETAKSLKGLRGVWDSLTQAVVTQPNWEKLAEANQPYPWIDRLNPSTVQLSVESNRVATDELAEGDEVCLEIICQGIVAELIRVKVISAPDENEYVEIELLESSILAHNLTAGRRIFKWTFDLCRPVGR